MTPEQRAVHACGGPSALARTLGVERSTPHKWVVRGRVPAEYVLELERLSGVSRHELRPDVYGEGP